MKKHLLHWTLCAAVIVVAIVALTRSSDVSAAWLLILLCPLMMIAMMGMMDRHDSHRPRASEESGTTAGDTPHAVEPDTRVG